MLGFLGNQYRKKSGGASGAEPHGGFGQTWQEGMVVDRMYTLFLLLCSHYDRTGMMLNQVCVCVCVVCVCVCERGCVCV